MFLEWVKVWLDTERHTSSLVACQLGLGLQNGFRCAAECRWLAAGLTEDVQQLASSRLRRRLQLLVGGTGEVWCHAHTEHQPAIACPRAGRRPSPNNINMGLSTCVHTHM
jgi:hypothetical protein